MKRALIISGGWAGHKPQVLAELFTSILGQAEFEVTKVSSLAVLANPKKLYGLDLIVPNWTMGKLTPKAEEGLLQAIEDGAGCGGCHGGMGDAFRNHPNFQFMVGGQFVAHPGDLKRYTVTPLPGHVITDGLTPFTLTSEQYYMHTDPSNRVLATTECDGVGAPWTKGVIMPAAWVRYYGQGRVFYCSIGHKVDDFDPPNARELLTRGLLWAARAL